ncbi:MAG: 50S ribosomal protein L20 [Candidatus Cloacimonetes bacterium]|nr:50S ribosomal protein L20 [Candidatus Cloacimonadota bacterium]MBS3767227.1 50S ribosomal protein L20 [Candidatus Cloacimonadota bacterium]
MARVTNKPASRKRRKKILKNAKGFRGSRKLYRNAKEAVRKGWQYSYRDRKTRKRNFRKLWITRINAAVREHDLSYSRFIHGLKQLDIELNRKTLAELAVNNPETFAKIVNATKEKLGKK